MVHIVRTAKSLDGRLRLKSNEKPFSQREVFDAKEIGSALKLRRRELGLSQEDVAKMTGHSIRVIGDIDRGKASVGIGIVLDYASLVDIDVVLKVRGRQ